MMKTIAAATAMALGAGSMSTPAAEAAATQHRYLIERTFPEGALDGVDDAVKAKVNANNKSLGVGWEKSYANANKTKTYCIYNAPDENAVREAAKLNGLPIDNITEIPLSFKAEPMSAAQSIKPGNHRYLVTRRSDVAFHDVNDGKFGVRLITSYLTQDKHNSYSIYEGPDFSSVEKAAKASGAPFESIAEVPETLYPR